MTPQERAVIEAAMALVLGGILYDFHDPSVVQLECAIENLVISCPQCRAGGHTCPEDGNPIGHTATDCGAHQDDMPGTVVMPLAPELVTPVWTETATMTIPGVMTDVPITHISVNSGPVWIETTMTNCLINDRIRLGVEETDVVRSNHGLWHVDAQDPWFPQRWEHIELRMELAAVPGFKQYPPAASIEILCTPQRLAVLRIQEGFPGSAVTSSHVD